MSATGKRRAFGQHFLRDRAISARIADAAVDGLLERRCASLLEIGPGRGAITEPILERLARRAPGTPVVLSERDRELADRWKGREGVQILEGDFLDLPEASWLSRAPLAVASNLPYSAGTAIATRLARHPGRVSIMVLMFQAEVARRLHAKPGTKAWGSLSIWIQNRWDVSPLCAVPPRAFSPPPEVDSEVVVLVPREVPRVAVEPSREPEWEGLLKASFAHRRKMLRSGLAQPYRNALERSGLDGTKRAEALDWGEWERLFLALSPVSSK